MQFKFSNVPQPQELYPMSSTLMMKAYFGKHLAKAALSIIKITQFHFSHNKFNTTP